MRAAVHVCIYVRERVCIPHEGYIHIYTHKKDIATLMAVKNIKKITGCNYAN